MQFQSDILGIILKRPLNTEMTALGVAFIAGLKSSFWDLSYLESLNDINIEFKPTFDKERINKLFENWNNAVKRSMNWV